MKSDRGYMMSMLITNNKQSLFQRCGTWMTIFLTNPYFIIFHCFKCSSILTVNEMHYNKKSNFLLQFQKVL